MTKIAVVHDQFRTMGGAERVAVTIARVFDAPIYAMRVDHDVPPDDVTVHNLSDRFGEWCMNRHWTIQDAYQMFAWQHCSELYKYDTLIMTKNNPMWFVPNVDRQTIIRYCHSPPRGMFDLFERRGARRLKRPLFTLQRLLYQQTTPYADRWLCNSEVVARRVRRYLDPANAPIDVLYPPVNTNKTSPERRTTQDYLFYVGRLAVNKRIDLIRDVAERIDTPVVVAGDGPFKDDLLTDQPDNLEYCGYISEAEKWDRLSEAKATLFLAESEDFGIVPIESMAAGTPVIGVNEGYTKHQIKDGKNGFCCEPTVPSVEANIALLDKLQWSDQQISEFAKQFSTNRFRTRIRDAVETTLEKTTIDPNHALPTPHAQHD